MKRKHVSSIIFAAVLCLSGTVLAVCPSADLTGDCRVDLADFAKLASQWLDEGSYMLHVNSSGIFGVVISSSTGHNGTTNYTQTPTVGTSVTLTAPAAVSDTTFTGWTGDVNSSNQTISFSMDADKTVTAIYEPSGMVWVSINDPGVSGHEPFNGRMSKYEITNAQYCQFLNTALASGDITVGVDNIIYGANGSNGGADFVGQVYYDLAGPGETYNGATYGGAARINYTGGVFTVDSGFRNHPVTYVSWYGATAFCNYYGYRLPTEWEWQAVADYNGSFIYGCGTTISNSKANYYGSTHPSGTTIVGAFGNYGYGMCDMAGNVWEWTSTEDGSSRVHRGGSWFSSGDGCTVSGRYSSNPYGTSDNGGFRVCR